MKRLYFAFFICFVVATTLGCGAQWYQRARYKEQNPLLDQAQQQVHIGTTYLLHGQHQNENKERAIYYYEKAHHHFSNALTIQPQSALIYYCLGVTWHKKSNNHEALRSLEKAIAIDPRNGQPYLLMAAIYVEEKQFDRAIGIYTQLLACNPNNSLIPQQLQQAHAKKKLYEQIA